MATTTATRPPARPAAKAQAQAQPQPTAGATTTALSKIAINRQRIPETVDFLSAAGEKLGAQLQPFRAAAVSKVFLGLSQIKTSLNGITNAMAGSGLPAQIIGVLHEPDGLPARQVQITFDPTALGGRPPATMVLTNDSGGFTQGR